MGINIFQYRACIGMFNQYKFSSHTIIIFQTIPLLYIIVWVLIYFLILLKSCLNFLSFSLKRSRNILLLQLFFYLWYIRSLSGDIETHPGPVSTNLQSLSICHWNLNSTTTENVIKIPFPDKQRSYDSRSNNLFRNFTIHTEYFKNSFFPYCVSEWNKLDPNIRSSTSI